MTKTQVEVITSVERRRRWSRAEKERIVAAAIEPAVASEVARAAGIDTSQLFRWRRELCGPAPSTAVFSPVVIAPGPEAVSTTAPMTGSAIEIELATGGRMRITGPVNRSTVAALIRALTRAKRRR
jgi:transposase